MPFKRNVMQTEVMIREVRRQDRDDLIYNYLQAYEEKKTNPLCVLTFEKKPTLKEERKWFDDLLKKIRKGDSFVLVAEVNHKIVGMCEIFTIAPYSEYKHVRELGIRIRDDYRSMGIGSALSKSTIKKAKEKGYKMLTLKVSGTNKHAQKLYRKFGFKVYGVLPEGRAWKDKRIDDVLMYLKL